MTSLKSEPMLSGQPQSVPAARSSGLQFASLTLIWGLSFLLIKVGERSFAPLALTCGRVVIGAATLVVFMLLRHERLPTSRRTWSHLFVTGILLNALPYSLYAYGERHVSSVLAGIWNATTPLFTLLSVIALIGAERQSRQRVLGVLIGFAGVLVVLGVWQGLGTTSLLGNTLCLGAPISYGVGYAYTQRFISPLEDSPLSLATGQLLCASLPLLIVTSMVGAPIHNAHAGPLLAVLALGAFGTGVAYILNYALVRSIGATRTSTTTYFMPIVSTTAGIVLLAEPLKLNQPLGALIILLGAAIGQGRVRRTSGRDGNT